MDCGNKQYIDLETIRKALLTNRELEFEQNNCSYFAQPLTNPPLPVRYRIWDETNRTYVFEGGLSELLSFEFPSGANLLRDFDSFAFLYIL